MKARVRLDGPPSPATRFGAERLICGAVGVDLASARSLLDRFPSLLPIAQSDAEAAELVDKLVGAGLLASTVVIPPGSHSHCAFHSRFLEASRCAGCSHALCVICERQGNGSCVECRRRAARRKRNQRIRISVLLTILFGVCLFGVKEWRRRHLAWDRAHRVLVVLVQEPQSPLLPAVGVRFAERASAVSLALTEQRRRYAPAAGAPVELSVAGPVDAVGVPPMLEDSGAWGLLQFNLALSRYAAAHDDRLGIDTSPFDVRLYVRVTPSGGLNVAAEGFGQQQGSIGVVSTEISEAGIDLAWFVAIHEYLHTRGASDKYGADGRARYPEGYAEPTLEPVLPQRGTELMARGRPQSLTDEDIPGAPETWVIGPWTAREIGWEPTAPGSGVIERERGPNANGPSP